MQLNSEFKYSVTNKQKMRVKMAVNGKLLFLLFNHQPTQMRS